MTEVDLTEPQARLLKILRDGPLGHRGMTKWQAADALGTTVQGALKILHGLTAKGFVHAPGAGYVQTWWPKEDR